MSGSRTQPSCAMSSRSSPTPCARLLRELSESTAEDEGETFIVVDRIASFARQRPSLAEPAKRVNNTAESERKRECTLGTRGNAPRFQIRVLQPLEPCVSGMEAVELLQEAECHHQRDERMRDR